MKLNVRHVHTKLTESLKDFALRTTGKADALDTFSDFLPAELVGHRIYLYGCGSRRGLHGPLCFIAVLDTRRKEWKWLQNDGLNRSEGQIFLYSDSIYHFGWRDWRDPETAKLSRFDLALEEWSCCHASGDAPMFREYSSGHFIEAKTKSMFVVFGGTADQPSNDVHLLNLSQLTWTQPEVKGTPPRPRFDHGSCVHNGALYCYGGYGNNMSLLNDGLYILHFGLRNTVTWSKLVSNAESLGPLAKFSMISFHETLLIFGGEREGDLHQVTMFDPAIKQFAQVKFAKDWTHEEVRLNAVSIECGREIALVTAGRDNPILRRVALTN